jgi:putative addiction module component (TIGR02574 family)
MAQPTLDITSLSPAERLDLIEELWDSLDANATDLPVTDAQRAELASRLEAVRSGQMATVPIEVVIEAIRSGRARSTS